MCARFTRMVEARTTHFKDLDPATCSILVAIDETFSFLIKEDHQGECGKERNRLKERATALLLEIGHLGGAAGIHLVIATQRPDAKVIPGELLNNCNARIACGRMDTIFSLMTLGNEAATRLPTTRGRSMVRFGQNLIEVQGYLTDPIARS